MTFLRMTLEVAFGLYMHAHTGNVSRFFFFLKKIRRTFNLSSVSSLSLGYMLYEGIQHSSCPLSIIPNQYNVLNKEDQAVVLRNM